MNPLEIHIPLSIKIDAPIKLTVHEGGGSVFPVYTGETTVTPKVKESIELETKNKVVLDNIVVNEVPYYETSNIKGTTFIVGGN